METILQFKQSDFDKFLIDMKNHITKEVQAIHKKETKVEDPISPKQAAAYLKISMTTFYERKKSGEIPERFFHGKGRKVQLFKSELEQHLKES